MLNAQDVCKRRLDTIESVLNTEVEQVFDWILKLIDRNTKNGIFGPLKLVLYHDENLLTELYKDDTKHYSSEDEDIEEIAPEYDLSIITKNYRREDFFNYLANTIKQENRFEADVTYGDDYYSTNTFLERDIYLKVRISVSSCKKVRLL